jgi:AraC family transcriptional regulator
MSTLQSRELYRSPLVSITDVHCRALDARCGGDEYANGHQLIFTRAGAFVKHAAGRQIVAEPAQVLFFNEREEYRVSHPVPGGDECTVLAFPAATLTEVLGGYEPAAAERLESPFSVTHGPVTPQALLRQQQLRHRLRGSPAARLEVEESALAILREVVHDAFRALGAHPRRHRAETQQSHRDVTEATKLLLVSAPAANVSLMDLARAVCRSPFHLARVFRDEVGLPIHQYLLRLRLALALERLADDTMPLTRLALDLGFSSHSHFTTLFVRAFGLSPSAFRRSATSARLRELRKNLEA